MPLFLSEKFHQVPFIHMELPGKMLGRRPGMFDDFPKILFHARLFFATVEIILIPVCDKIYRNCFGKLIFPFPGLWSWVNGMLQTIVKAIFPYSFLKQSIWQFG
jgi:hypothetical protein